MARSFYRVVVGALALLPTAGLSAQESPAPGPLVARLEVQRFGLPIACGSAFAARPGGLFLTTYSTIRGAEQARALLAGSQLGDSVLVAAHDPAADLAVLYLDDAPTQSTPTATDPVHNQQAWIWIRSTAGVLSSTVREVWVASDGTVRLSQQADACSLGSPITAEDGSVIGMVGQGVALHPFRSADAILAEAERNAAQGSFRSVLSVAIQERHRFGTISLTSDVPGTGVRIAPREEWQWPGTGVTGTLPMTFAGPMGRYEVEMVFEGEIRGRQQMEIQPGVGIQMTLFLGEAGGGSGSSVLPWFLGAVGAAAAGGALLVSGGGDSGGGSGGGDPIFSGAITVFVPQWHP